ncbi:hypothetical protein QFC22_004403 [Naganishia vaughanmartiniae]|uniref:Uncharacterized protein n=1 Tax=Naganishia vaughanmartiniae TaxID=1424756 RepID=A0ACC2X1B7_9TREE|nr:hypothetical protein QFC22_004403 [Naganishia vaughanmartiniae]
MVSFKSLATAVVTAGFAVSGVLAELSIVSPSSEIFWVGNQRAGDNYVIELTDILNSSNVYATSQPFSIKQQGTLYPTATTATSPLQSTGTAAVAASSGGASSSKSASASASASSAATSAKSGALKNTVVGGGALMAVGGLVFSLL